ncbi:Fe-S-cluster-containing hydrogenase subunit [Halalkaliarchaeum desulfuricum]|uniref:Fe-S-cluster-containing hydrogenase subunit n=1 Tax=Halalkaliarchaeum desulfuricum TaxID=2055893 RepID=A0A343TKU6_9EURY|nr:4Fe-4S ferredoxin N-terminal domain-containing protein [Halalkaliarchaeum desulfuricum]AUX09718.1 Fe-S-cluster-containing hydrogenase subunit [Halalkaliarchaeum desulfuricum]
MADLPPKKGDPEWEEWAEDILDSTEFDTELGKQISKDALRIAEGELSKAEFHERYGDEVKAEFGVDERPTKPDPEPDNTMPRVPGDRNQTRRNVLKAMGGAAAAVGLAGCVSASADDGSESDGNPDSDTQIGMAIDTERCIACLQCSEACKEENNTDIGVHWPYVFRYEDEHAGDTREDFLTRHCQHCSEPSCTYVCPTQARYRRTEDGIVLTDYDTCVGCKYCQVACPYGVNYLGKDEPNEVVGSEFEGDRVGRDGRTVGGNPPKGVMGKCTYCVHRQDSDDPELQGTTACEQACPVDVIHFGDMNDRDSDPREHLREKEGSNQYRLLDEVGNEPNIVYIGKRPSKDAEPVQGPVSYEELNMRDGNYDYVGAQDEAPADGEEGDAA